MTEFPIPGFTTDRIGKTYWTVRNTVQLAIGCCLLPALVAFLCGCSGPKTAANGRQAAAGTASAGSSVVPKPDGQADNASCLICHVDFSKEPIAVRHLEEGFGCTACHGESTTHERDELKVAKPDVLFGRAAVTPFCKTCHPTHTTGTEYEAFVTKWRGRRRPNGRMILADAVCTDCHGLHATLRPEQTTTTDAP